jgi:TPP-dependent indolepyruvate ferredoxin oxidoreductase alpha subunit
MSDWSEKVIDEWKQQCHIGELRGSYTIEDTNLLMTALRRMRIDGASVLVIGSERPWIEACVLSLGATEVTTIEYGGIQSTHPRVQTLTPERVRASANAFMERFDVVVTYSSVEHSGLGRYGDALNPWGDRQAMARAWCMTKRGGQLAIGVPHKPADIIHYNAHREYGPIQLPHLLANWKQIWRTEGNSYQPVWVCEK